MMLYRETVLVGVIASQIDKPATSGLVCIWARSVISEDGNRRSRVFAIAWANGERRL